MAGSAPILLERSIEAALTVDALDRAVDAGGGGMLLFEGAAGIGKTSVQDAACDAGVARGFAVASARGRNLEQDFAWGLARQLFEPIAGQFEAILRSTPAAGLAVELLAGAGMPEVRQQGEYGLIHSLLWLTNDVASRRPLLVVVDDLHWSDIPSLRFLAYLAARLDDLPVVIIGAIRPGVQRVEQVLSAMVDTPAVTVHNLRPFTVKATGQLLGRVMQKEPAPGVVRRCHELTQGNPMLVRELGRQLAEEPNADKVEELLTSRVPTLDRYVGRQLRHLPQHAVTAIRALAVLGEDAAADRVGLVADLPVADVLDAVARLQAAELIVTSGHPETYSLSHPLVQAAIYQTLSPADRAELHMRAASTALRRHEPERAASHLLRVPPGLADLDVAAVLADAADRCIARGSMDSAVAYLRRQLDEDLGDDRHAALTGLGLAEAAVNDPGASEHLSVALAQEPDPERRLMLVLVLAAIMFSTGAPDKALHLVRSALEREVGLSGNARRALQAYRVLFVHLTPTDEDLDQLLDQLSSQPADSSPGGHMLDAMIGLMYGFRGQREQAQSRALQALDSDDLIDHPMAEVAAGAAWTALLMADAAQLPSALETAVEYGRKTGSLRARTHALTYRSGLMLAHGNLHEAVSDGRGAWEACRATATDARLLWIGNYLVQALVASGELDEAESIVAQVKAHGGKLPRNIDANGQLSLLIARGEIDQALEVVDAARRDCQTYTIRNPVQCDWRGSLVHCLHLKAQTDEARPYAAENLQLAQEWGTARGIGMALRTAALCETGQQQIDLLSESVSTLADSSARYELALSQHALGDALRRAKRHSEARTHLQAAFQLAEACGANPLREQAAMTLRLIGARPAPTAKLGPAALTPGELRVAELAAKGLTNREIAQHLFVTIKTVEVHLSRTFPKLGIYRRQQLSRALVDK